MLRKPRARDVNLDVGLNEAEGEGASESDAGMVADGNNGSWHNLISKEREQMKRGYSRKVRPSIYGHEPNS